MKDPKVKENAEKSESKEGFYVPKRYIMTLLSFLGMFNIYALRVNLSVAMVAMVNNTKSSDAWDNYSYFMECPELISGMDESETESFKGEQYNWDAQAQGIILGSFFYGYIITQLPGGFLSEKYSAKWLFGCGTLVTAIFSLLTPAAAHWGTAPFIAVRVLEGLGEGVTFPAINVLISHWSPKLERSRVSTIIFTGSQIGNVIAMPISGWLSSSDVLGGWPSVFYVFGTIGCIWFVFWAFLIHETPFRHPKISKSELKYFEESKGNNQNKKPKTPWRSIFTSLPMWAVVVAHFGHNFGFLILLTELPSYLSSILHFDIKSDGTLSALPYIVQALSAWLASYIADKLRTSGRLSITTIRKLSNSVGLFGPAACLLGVTVIGCRPNVTITLFSVALALNGFIYSGFNITHVDMSPVFAGTLFGITNAISNLCGIIGPAIVGAFTKSGATITNWNSVFYITAGVYVVTATFYAAFASAELQSWAFGSEGSETKDAKLKDIIIQPQYGEYKAPNSTEEFSPVRKKSLPPVKVAG
ncbi:sialin-like [Uloborus diversus]|uniref:sialin-like n=1 Tax=Uloborus diversus TaxID=327109 RepID=UPI0024096C6A|nr:sialin-like [Uloborus diversus]